MCEFFIWFTAKKDLLYIFLDFKDQSPEVMFARIWLQKCVLAIYDCGFCLLDIEPVNYM